MIAELAADLLAKVQAVPALTTRTGLTLGGRAQDPGLLKVSTPAAWIVMKGDQVDDDSNSTHGPASGFVPKTQTMLGVWSVTLFIGYVDDADMITNQYPLLEATAEAVHATETPSGMRWRYIGQKVVTVYPDRLAYELRFTVNYPTST